MARDWTVARAFAVSACVHGALIAATAVAVAGRENARGIELEAVGPIGRGPTRSRNRRVAQLTEHGAGAALTPIDRWIAIPTPPGSRVGGSPAGDRSTRRSKEGSASAEAKRRDPCTALDRCAGDAEPGPKAEEAHRPHVLPPRRPVIACPFRDHHVSRDAIARTIGEHVRRLTICYHRTPGLAGLTDKVTVQFDLAPDGGVSGVQIAEDTSGSEVLTSCVRRVFETMHFPARRCRHAVEVRYPIVFAVP